MTCQSLRDVRYPVLELFQQNVPLKTTRQLCKEQTTASKHACKKYSWQLVVASLAHVTSPCGSNSRDPQDVQCITLNECNKDVSTHLKKLNVGNDTINDENNLLLAGAGAVIIHYCYRSIVLLFFFII